MRHLVVAPLFGRGRETTQPPCELLFLTTTMPILLDLPPEILILIFSSLDLPALTSCLATNRHVKSIIDGSTLLQYRLAALAACVEDNPGNTDIDSAHKLAALQRRQKHFTELRPASARTVEVDLVIRTYSLSGGVFVATERDSGILKWISLLTKEPVLQRLEVHGYVQDMVLAVPEDDLLAIVLASNPAGPVVELCFYEMSTQSAHRMARKAVIKVPIPGEDIEHTALDVCGSKLSLLIDYDSDWNITSHLLIYDWKQGHLLMDIRGEYKTTTFLSPDVILLVQESAGTLELWSIPGNVAQDILPRVSLKLPQLADGGTYEISSLESNPKGPTPLFSREPFHASFADSIIVLEVCILLDDGPEEAVFDLVLPRSALLQLLPLPGEYEKELLWGEWGPPISQWLGRSISDNWAPVICGQRYVNVEPDSRIRLLDFNPHTHRKLTTTSDATGEDTTVCTDSGEAIQRVDGLTLGIFAEKLSPQLGCVVAHASERTVYNGVLLDEKCIVGIKDTMFVDGKLSFDIWDLE
ncbi:hypothetical protein C8R46DRAFT_1064088 [Mycena filopes]|nr:hypothetical protein C8R46DRAFT_1064088 [Mycena filopes]